LFCAPFCHLSVKTPVLSLEGSSPECHKYYKNVLVQINKISPLLYNSVLVLP
jgi:hypothetical protein